MKLDVARRGARVIDEENTLNFAFANRANPPLPVGCKQSNIGVINLNLAPVNEEFHYRQSPGTRDFFGFP